MSKLTESMQDLESSLSAINATVEHFRRRMKDVKNMDNDERLTLQDAILEASKHLIDCSYNVKHVKSVLYKCWRKKWLIAEQRKIRNELHDNKHVLERYVDDEIEELV